MRGTTLFERRILPSLSSLRFPALAAPLLLGPVGCLEESAPADQAEEPVDTASSDLGIEVRRLDPATASEGLPRVDDESVPADAVPLAGTMCVDDDGCGACEQCSAGRCTLRNAGFVCEAANDPCEEDAECDGANPTCPTPAASTAGTVLRSQTRTANRTRSATERA